MLPRIPSFAPAVLLLAATAPALRADDVPVGQVAAVVDLNKIDLSRPGGMTPAYGRLSDDGSRLAAITLDGGAFWLIDAVNGKQIHFLRGDDFTPNVHFSLVSLSPDGKLVTAAEGGGAVLVLDAESGKQLLSVKPLAPGPSARFSPDGKWLALYTFRQGNVYNAATGEQAAVIFDPKDFGKDNRLVGVAFSPDGKRLLVCEKARIRLKESDTGKELLNLPLAEMPAKALFSPDGKQFTAWVGSQCRVWDLDGKELKAFPAPGKSNFPHVFSPDGTLLAGKDGDSQKVWSANTGQEAVKLADPATQKGGFASLAFSADGKRLAVWYQDAAKVVWWQVAK